MSNRYPYQVQSRMTAQEEVDIAKKLAKDNGISISAMVRLLILQASREGWAVGIHKKRRPA